MKKNIDMLKELIKEIIVSNQERISGLHIKPRDAHIVSNANYVITGARRAGKTYFLYQIIKEHYHNIENVLYINFEDERLIELNSQSLHLIIDAYYEIYRNKPVVFFDEIQNIPHWEKFVRRLADQDYRIYITGSNSNMLSRQMASVLGGRFINLEILPLSFKEFLHFHDIKLKSNSFFGQKANEIKRLFNEYFRYGGFPEIVNFDDKRTYLSNLFNHVFYGDIVVRYKVKNEWALKLLIKKLAESVNNETSLNRIKNIIKSIGIPVGTQTLLEYISYFKESYLIFSISNSSNKFVEKESKKKYYFIDNGILNLFLFNQDTKLLENLIFLHLYRKNDEIFFYKKNMEIDFYLPQKNELIQVSYDIWDSETEKRELRAIEKASKYLNCNKAIIITYDTEKVLNIGDMQVQVMPAWKFLLVD